MEMKEIYRLAYLKAVDIWAREDELAHRADNPLAKARAEEAWEKVEQISELLKAVE